MSKNRKIKDTSVGGGRKGDRDAGETRREVFGVIGLGAALFLLRRDDLAAGRTRW